jgi:hypothetical protein
MKTPNKKTASEPFSDVKALLKTFAKAGKRVHMLGDADAGVLVALDLEGRWFAVLQGKVLNRINPDAIVGQSTADQYLNPGGDGLWPAPEGTALGYQYATGKWRVAPGLRAARYIVSAATDQSVSIIAEVDLINSRGLGIPTLFQRDISVVHERTSLAVTAVESITYIGRTPLRRSEGRLAPWTLGQFDCGPGCDVVFPCAKKASVWDLYDPPSDAQREWTGEQCCTRTDGSMRYQIAIDAKTPWIEFRDPRRGLTVRRTAEPLPADQSFIDIRDASPDQMPGNKGVRYSVYSDASNFMEIEAAGGCPAVLRPDTKMSVVVRTQFART